jgi:limonene-1,2-epoxide hydrolase
MGVSTVDTANAAREVVLSCIKAINEEDFREARRYVSEGMTFEGVLGSRFGADAYFHDMERMKLKYDIHKVFSEGDDVCVLYQLQISGKTIFSCGLYEVRHGRITSLKVVFDPRPLLDEPKK